MLELNVLVLGLLNGAIYALVGSGLSLTYGRQNVIDVANPAFVIAGAYAVATLAGKSGLDPYVVTPLSVVGLFIAGAIVQLLLINPLLSRPDFEMHVQSALVLFGFALLAQTLLVIIFSADIQAIHTAYSDNVFVFGKLRLPHTKLAAAGLACAALVSLYWYLHHTFPGKAVLATYADRETAQLLSINVKRIDVVTYGLGAALAGIAGLVVALSFPFSPASIASWTVIAFTVAVIGGKGSILGTLVAGFIVGLVEAIVSVTISANWIYLAVYSMLLLVFVFRPNGFFGDRY